MAASKKERRELAKQLKEARAKRIVLLKKVDKTRVKFERRSHKLQALEAEIADLSRRVFGPDAPALEPTVAADASQPLDELQPEEEQPTPDEDPPPSA